MTEHVRKIDEVTIDVEPPGSADARWCIERYFDDLVARIAAGFDKTQTSQIDDADLSPPRGLLLVARLNGRPVGCGALKLRDGITEEIKRVWVDDTARGRGIGRKLMNTLEDMARQRGLSALRLDTNGELTEAHALYRACGYRQIARFNDEPFAHHWLGKSIV